MCSRSVSLVRLRILKVIARVSGHLLTTNAGSAALQLTEPESSAAQHRLCVHAPKSEPNSLLRPMTLLDNAKPSWSQFRERTIFNGWTKRKSWKFSFSRNARTHGSMHRAGDRCHAMPWRQQSRTAQARSARLTHQRCAQQTRQRCAQKTSSYITARPWLPVLIVGPCPSEESLCCPACPPPPPPLLFFADSRPPVSKVACLISLYLLSTCMYHTFSHITFLGYNHMISRASVFLGSLLSEHIIRCHMCPLGRLLPGYDTRFFLQRGCCC